MPSANGRSREEDEGDRLFPFPDLTSYVTIKLDPVASVELLEDEEATMAAQKMVNKTYVGYVGDRGNWDDDDDEDNASYHINLLRSGLPRASPEEFIEQDMCIPVFPNTNHPTRQAVTPSKPLPWTDCYHASFEKAPLRVPATSATTDMAINLPSSSRTMHNKAMLQDQKRHQSLKQAAHPTAHQPIPAYPQRRPIPPIEDKDNSTPTSRQSVSSRAATISIVSVRDEDGSAKPIPPPLSIMSYDLAAVATVEDPQDLLKEIKFIEQLYKEARERAPARRARAAEEIARAIADAKKLDDATFGSSFKQASIPQDASAPSTEPSHAPPLDVEPTSNTHRRPFHAFVTYFGKLSFWGARTQSPSSLVVVLGRWKNRLRPYACGICGSTGSTVEESEVDAEKTDVLSAAVNQKPRASDTPGSPLEEKHPRVVPPAPIAA